MAEKVEEKLFKKGSTTHYFSTSFFPKKYRRDVYALFSFIQVADDYVDKQPAQSKKLLALEKAYLKAIDDPNFEVIPHGWDDLDTRVIKNIVRLSHKYKFDRSWVESFFWSMKQDINHGGYKSLEDSLRYVYGSAEVVGLMIAKITGVQEAGYEAVRAQGRAMQWVNFIRGIEEDNQLGRVYFPRDDLRKYKLKNLSRSTAESQVQDFTRFMQFQIKRYRYWQAEADKGNQFVPLRMRSALKTAAEMFEWTAKQIEKDPLIIYDKQVRPRKLRILLSGARRFAKQAGKTLTKQEQIITKK